MSSITTKPIDAISWLDISGLAGTTEAGDLEFKRDLHVPKGGVHPWHTGGELDRHARDAIAAEVVAFANTWGGTLVLGVGEGSGSPRICTGPVPIPRPALLAERLESALRSVIDPPIAGLACRAVVDPDAPDTGVVVVRINRSTLAPHGFNQPAVSYVRRGTSCAPMTMRDLHNVFWESRTRVEKIAASRHRSTEFLRKCKADLDLLILADKPVQRVPGIYARFSAYPHEPLQIDDADVREFWVKVLRPEGRSVFRNPPVCPFGDGVVDWSPSPIAHGFEIISAGPSRWIVKDDGSIEVFGFRKASAIQGADGHFIQPGWLVSPAAQLITMCEMLRRRSGRPGIPYEIDCQFIPDATGSHHAVEGAWSAEGKANLSEEISVGPFIFDQMERAPNVFAHIEREIWRGLGVAGVVPLPFTPERALSAFSALVTR